MPFTDGATADSTALVATAGLLVRPLADAEFSSAECVEGVATAGAGAAGGCGRLAGSVDAGWSCWAAAAEPFVSAAWDATSGVEIECAVEIGGFDEPKPFASVVSGGWP